MGDIHTPPAGALLLWKLLMPLCMIRFENVTVKENNQTIIDAVTFEINEKEKVVFFGESGSGKTTILTTIVGGHIPAGGTVYFKGEPVGRRNILKLRRSVSHIGQEPLLGAEKVLDAVLLPFTYKANRNHKPDHAKILQTIDKLHLDPKILRADTSVISSGEKQRVAIARELLQQKTIFVLDEVTSALDLESKMAVLNLFRDTDYTVISASHDPQWLKLCTRFFRVDKGKIFESKEMPKF